MSDREFMARMTAEQAETFAELSAGANGGDAGAACQLGDHFREGDRLPTSPKEAFRWYARSAMGGDAAGQNNLGACYEHGVGCRPNPRQAAKWYARSAAQHHSTAQTNLGLCYLEGRGVTRDIFEATRWLEKAQRQRDPVAVAKLKELWDSPETRAAMYSPAPNRVGRWTESHWITESSGAWDCVGTDILMSDSAEERSQELTGKHGPPRVKIITQVSRSYVTLTWAVEPSSYEVQLRQDVFQREHVDDRLGSDER